MQKDPEEESQQQRNIDFNIDLDSDNQQLQEEPYSKWEAIEEPQRTLPLFMLDFEHCDSKKCTGKKMERFKLLSTIKDRKKKFRGVVLSAFGKKYITINDLEYIEKHGICVIDCSWNRIEQTREFRYKHQRKLPFVVAGNPVNFGKPYQLSCAEALATALAAIGFMAQAKYIMSKFAWADGFWKENPNLQLYAKSQTQQQIEQQSKINEQERTVGFQRKYEYPPDSSDEEAQKYQ